MAEQKTGCLTKIALVVVAVVAFKVCSGAGDKSATQTSVASSLTVTPSAPLSPKEASELAVRQARGEPPEMINGCCFKCYSYAKRTANDPDSIECVQSTVPQIEGDKWVTTTTLRGKNGFGAKVLTKKKFYLQDNRVVDVK